MEARTYYEWSQYHKYENGAYSIYGQRVLPSVCTSESARSFRFAGSQMMVPKLLQ